jgi:hypothetical protein
MTKQEVLKEKINSILSWSEDLCNEYYIYYDNGYGRDYDSIYTIVNAMIERAKEVKEILKDNQFN